MINLIRKYWEAAMVVGGLLVTVGSNFLPSDPWRTIAADMGLVLITSVYWGPWLLPKLIDLVINQPRLSAAIWALLLLEALILKLRWSFLGLFALGIIIAVISIVVALNTPKPSDP